MAQSVLHGDICTSTTHLEDGERVEEPERERVHEVAEQSDVPRLHVVLSNDTLSDSTLVLSPILL